MKNTKNISRVIVTVIFLLPGILSWGQNDNNDEEGIVERDRTRMIQVFGDKIKQDGVLIGKIEDDTKAKDGKLYDYYMVYLPNGVLVAEVTMQKFDSDDCRIITVDDHKEHHLAVGNTSSTIKKQIAKYLVERYYL